MKFKVGVGLLLFGILLSNGSSFYIGGYLYLVGGFIGFIGLSLIFLNCTENNKDMNG